MSTSSPSGSRDNRDIFMVEHLATFSTSLPQQSQNKQQQNQPITPKIALQRLFAMEKTSGIWTQRMTLKLEGSTMLIVDGESNNIVERFPVTLIQEPTAFNHHNHIYNNILIFTVQHPEESQGELHIFQCVSHSAQQVVEELNSWLRKGEMHSDDIQSPSSNISVKQAVNAFNAIAAQREKNSVSPIPGSPHRRSPMGPIHQGSRDQDSRSIVTTSSIDSSNHNGAHRTSSHEQSLSNERYVSILNHCFDDIERFIIRLQHAAAALRELQLRNHKRQGKGPTHGGEGLLAIRARGPSEEEFFEILSKFKLAFNLLAKLKGCIHDPNAPELVHFLFTPLAIIIDAARSTGPAPIDPSVVGVPYLNSEAIELLSNCCTSKEYDLWQSLGVNWTQAVRHHIVQPSRALPGSYQPVFTDGWAPTITDPELMGLTSSSDQSEQEEDSMPIPIHVRETTPMRRELSGYGGSRHQQYADSDVDEQLDRSGVHSSRISPHRANPSLRRDHPPSSPIDSIDRDSPITQMNDLEQSEWLADLQMRNAKIVRVLFPRTANNDKELTVVRGEFLEILDDSRKWWKARNWRGQIAHVPHTIVSEVATTCGSSSMIRETDSQIHNDSMHEDWIRKERQGKKGEFRYF